LLAHATAANYLTEEQANDVAKLDMLKLRQVLARCTNEILASWQITMRRDKQAEFEVLVSLNYLNFRRAFQLSSYQANNPCLNV